VTKHKDHRLGLYSLAVTLHFLSTAKAEKHRRPKEPFMHTDVMNAPAVTGMAEIRHQFTRTSNFTHCSTKATLFHFIQAKPD
jgi:hypothetical protein